MYLHRFRTANPFSLPFKFDIENTWVSLALREDSYYSEATEDHAELLRNAFAKEKMLIIEGNPATGKTSLMRRLAYDWAKKSAPLKANFLRKLFKIFSKSSISNFGLIIYAEFREVREQEFETIADLIIAYTKNYMESEEHEYLKLLLNNRNYCKEQRILLLLDGYDESSLHKQCKELTTYLTSGTIKKPLAFNIVLTTRPGYCGKRGRFVFANVLGFTTSKQKEKYILSHFKSAEIDNQENIVAVHRLLNRNKNLNKLAETPLFLTFICLVYERIIDGTLLELYCSMVWWLIDRHQRDFLGRNISDLFGYENYSNDKFETLQDHYLEFPQLHTLGKMALNKLEENVFQQSDCDQFNLKPIIEQVGLLRKEKTHDQSFRLTTTFSFPHKTIQEFLAALYCFISDENTDQWFPTDSEMDTYEMKEFNKFLLRIALSKQIPINTAKQKIYFEKITKLTFDLTFDAFNTTAGLNITLLNWFISQCTNIQELQLNWNESETTSVQNHLTFTNLINLDSLYIWNCIFEANSQISFINCPSLKYPKFIQCKINSSARIDFSKLPALDILEFDKCTIDLNAWQSITDEIKRSSVKQLKLSCDFFEEEEYSQYFIYLQKCKSIEKIEIIIWVIFNEEQLTTNLSNLTREMKGLKRITFDIYGERMKEINMKIIEKAGQERDPAFKVI